jgi:peptidoglycan/xylan/chitin deacetylase (PgdA/CDA1 family)
VLVHHSVRATPPPGLEGWTVTPQAFADQLDEVAASGRTSLTISELARGLQGREALPAAPVALTFDDGFADNTAALELLVGRGLRATLYVTTGLIGRPDMLSAAAVRDLATLDGLELGAHSVEHVRLDELAPHEVAQQVRGSRQALEDLIGREVASFAYPHGCHDREVRAAIVGAGLESAAAVKNAFSHPQDDPFAIARWLVPSDASRERVAEVLAGRGLPRAWARERVRTRASRVVRRARRRRAVRPVSPPPRTTSHP